MKPEQRARKNISDSIKVSASIVDLFERVKASEKEDLFEGELHQKSLFQLKELLSQEKSLYEKIFLNQKNDEYGNIVYGIMNSPQKFKMQYGINYVREDVFYRFFRNLFIYGKVEGLEISILNFFPEFAHLQFKMINNNSKLFEAFSEDLFYVYIKLLEKTIKNLSKTETKNSLIDEKYSIFIKYSNTNEYFIKSKQNNENEIDSKAIKVVEEENLNHKLYDFLVMQFVYNFSTEFFDNMLEVSDREYNTRKKVKGLVMRLLMLESVLTLVDAKTIENVESIFNDKYVTHDLIHNSNNKNITLAIKGVFERFKVKSHKIRI